MAKLANFFFGFLQQKHRKAEAFAAFCCALQVICGEVSFLPQLLGLRARVMLVGSGLLCTRGK